VPDMGRKTLVCRDWTLITIDGCCLEIRGDGWGPRRKKSESPGFDRVRRCRLDSHSQAVDIAKLLKEIIDSE